MAYGEKYYHTYCDRHGDTYRISIQVEGYTGDATKVECGVEQFVIERENSSGLAIGGVYPTRATATFISDVGFNLEELYTGNERTYLLVRYRNGQLNWQGNIVADGFTEDNWDEKRVRLTVKATDNLAGLKGIPFTDSLGENYGNDGVNIQTFLWAIKEGLKKTGFNMNIWTMVDIKSMIQSNTIVYTETIYQREGFSNEIAIYFNTSGGADNFIDATKIGDFINVTTGEIAGFRGTIAHIERETDQRQRRVFLTIDDEVPYFDYYGATFEIGEQPVGQNGDLLSNTQHDVRVWIRDSNVEGKTYFEARGGAMDTWSVLDAIARQWNAIIQQNEGHWEIKRWNSDKLPDGEYEWFVYNSEGIFIGHEDFGGDILIPCRSTSTEYRMIGTNIDMDRVLKNVIVNYRYKYRQDGDALKNLVDNPNFEPGKSGWTIISNGLSPSISATQYTGSIPISGIGTAISIKNIYNGQFYANRILKNEASDLRQVNKGDKISISWWEKIEGSAPYEDNVASVFQVSIWGMAQYGPSAVRDMIYDLVLSRIDNPVASTINGVRVAEQRYGASWEQKKSSDEHIRFGAIQRTQRDGSVGKGSWRKVILDIDDIPIDGYAVIEIYGVATLFKNNILPVPISFLGPSIKDRKVRIKGLVSQENGGVFELQTIDTYFTVTKLQSYILTVTGFQFNKIIDPDNDVVPQIDPFMYPDYQSQLSRYYSDTINEVEVLTGDDYGQYVDDRISGMSIGGSPTKFWDTWDNRFGWSRQGLITAKSIMELYWEPSRLVQCEINTKGLHWSSRIQFEELPRKRFVILRGSIGGHDSTFKGVLKEIYDNAEIPIPPGGNDGGNTVDPDWQPTGIVRCVKDNSGLNTGGIERVEVDNNPASTTYGQERWVSAGEDTVTCPIGSPPEIFWGEQLTLFVNTLRTDPYVKSEDTYTVTFSNDGSNVYLRFLHLASLGTIRSIYYETGAESTTGWEYEPDVVIEGYTYKHIKLTWFVGVISGLQVNFEIN